MMKIIVSFLFCVLMVTNGIAQTNSKESRILMLKDRGVVVHSYTAGDYINFQFSNKQWLTGYIDWIKNDSVQINQFALQSIITVYGTYGEDTLKLGKLALHINELIAFPKEKGHFNSVFTNGAFLKTAGIGYLGLNVINSLSHRDPLFEKDNLSKLIGGALTWASGVLVHKSNPNYRPIGKRYTVETL
jgi:hypothetical protein